MSLGLRRKSGKFYTWQNLLHGRCLWSPWQVVTDKYKVWKESSNWDTAPPIALVGTQSMMRCLVIFLENNSSPTRFDKVQRSIHINASKYIVMMLFQRLTDYVLASLLKIRFRQVCQNVIWIKNQVCQNVIWTKNQVWQNVIWTKNQISTKHVSAGV